MSHFTVLVIGPDYKKQLAPYHEFECTGTVDEHVQTIDDTDEMRKTYEQHAENGESFLSFLDGWVSRPVLTPGEEPDLEDAHKWGWIEVDADGNVVKTVDRTNPNRKWDWYLVGGRWTGYFPLKRGAAGATGEPGLMTPGAKPGTADQCRWGDVDIERARREAAEKGRAEFDEWRRAFEQHGKPKSWAEVREECGENVDKARAIFNAQPAIKAMPRVWGCPVATYGFDEDTYVKRCAARALVPFAVVKDGEWYEKGSMGWWGMVADEKDQDAWNAQVATLLDGLDPDTQVTLVDCHI